MSFLTPSEQLHALALSLQRAGNLDVAQDDVKHVIREDKPLDAVGWQQMPADKSVMATVTPFFLSEAPPREAYAWRNATDDVLVVCAYDAVNERFVVRNMTTSETHTVTRQDGPEMLLTGNKVPGISGQWTVWKWTPQAEPKAEPQPQPQPQPQPEPQAQEPVQKRAKVSKKKALATPVVSEATGETVV